ncbi:NAD(P)H-hydrate dehydratase [Brevundimonas sp.]|uniref:NAD(P)H-hydrate dehydratase n=1 Tax=Brevundimonas sp. TaxID=1871086 RepID=UPI0025DE7D33|nr:NAD(P)H-hydrate dehydratase [Brevundimonas sp.]
MSGLGVNGPSLWLDRYPWPAADTHKHARGRLGVVSGPQPSSGAARLACRGGLRIGAGTCRLFCPPEALPLHAPGVEAVMIQSFRDAGELKSLAEVMAALVIGPAAGLRPETEAWLRAVAETEARLVIDADALTLFRERSEDLFVLLRQGDVLTPHEGEFERLWPGLLEGKGREAACREAARTSGTVVVLKGQETLIGAPDGRLARNPNGTPWLATAGSGDVLAGLIGGLMAQGMDSFDAACAGVWIHAEAAGLFGPGLIAEDLPELVPQVLARLWKERG